MDSSIVYEAVYKHFLNYEYKLLNSFVYDWECDFFAMSKSGYFMEVEVKVSRGDYFNDCKKEKHELFQSVYAKKTHHIARNNYQLHIPERLIGEYIEPNIEFEYDGKDRGEGVYNRYNWQRALKNSKAGWWVNDFGRSWVRQQRKRIYAQSTGINIKPLSEIRCPNSLYFACPENLIRVDEVPAYAGLIYVRDIYGCNVIKKAPYLHKTKQDMTKILLKKFYNLWQYKIERDEKLQTLSNKPIK